MHFKVTVRAVSLEGSTLNALATLLAAFMCPMLAKALPTKADKKVANNVAKLTEGNTHPLDPGCAVVSNVVCFPTPHPQRLKKEGLRAIEWVI